MIHGNNNNYYNYANKQQNKNKDEHCFDVIINTSSLASSGTSDRVEHHTDPRVNTHKIRVQNSFVVLFRPNFKKITCFL